MAYAGTQEMPSSVNIHSLMHMYDLVQPLTQLRLVHAAAYLYMLDTCSVGEGFPWKFTAMASTGFKELRAPPMLGLGNWISMYIPKIHHWWHCWIFQLHMKLWTMKGWNTIHSVQKAYKSYISRPKFNSSPLNKWHLEGPYVPFKMVPF